MNSTIDCADLTSGQALLSRLPDCYFNILKTAHLEQTAGDEVVCTFEIPGNGKLTVSAASSVEAIRSALIELATTIDISFFSESEHPMSASVFSTGETKLSPDTKAERFRSKTRQVTVGVSMPRSLKETLTALADSQGASFAEVARRFAVFGFEDFVDRSLFVSSNSLLEMLGRELVKWQSSDSEQVMLRLDPGHAVRMRTAAMEFGKSASELGALCMAHGLVIQEQLVFIEAKVTSCKGPAIRPLLAQVGMGSYAASLLSGVLAGHIRAPKSLLKRLANVFEAPETLLTTLFRSSFESRMIPSFKAENGKPEVSVTATPWDLAVKSLNLPPEQTKELLDLGAKRI
jgi:hypothetical protein